MFSHSKTLSHYSAENVVIWCSMAFQAGAINVGGFLACHRFVSHTTGFATHFAAEAANGHLLSGLGMLSVPVFFLAGSMVSAILVDTRIQKDLRPLYPLVFSLMFLILLSVVYGGTTGKFGEFGKALNIYVDYYLMTALAFVSGLQNATVSSAFNSVIRTTHLTGLTTDLGIGLTRIFRKAHKINSRENEIRASLMRISIVGSFTLGSALSAYIYLNTEYWGFLIPACIAMILFIWSTLEINRQSKNLT